MLKIYRIYEIMFDCLYDSLYDIYCFYFSSTATAVQAIVGRRISKYVFICLISADYLSLLASTANITRISLASFTTFDNNSFFEIFLPNFDNSYGSMSKKKYFQSSNKEADCFNCICKLVGSMWVHMYILFFPMSGQ